MTDDEKIAMGLARIRGFIEGFLDEDARLRRQHAQAKVKDFQQMIDQINQLQLTKEVHHAWRTDLLTKLVNHKLYWEELS